MQSTREGQWGKGGSGSFSAEFENEAGGLELEKFNYLLPWSEWPAGFQEMPAALGIGVMG